jgi:hypothetical protein
MSTQPYNPRRRAERHRVSKAVVLIFETQDDLQPTAAETLDLSEQGARVKSHSLLTPGQVLEFRTEDNAKVVRCRVVWTGDMTPDREAEAGLEFLMPLQV